MARVAGIVLAVDSFVSKKGNPVLKVTLHIPSEGKVHEVLCNNKVPIECGKQYVFSLGKSLGFADEVLPVAGVVEVPRNGGAALVA